MIHHTAINGKPCTVADLPNGMVKILFDDGDMWIAHLVVEKQDLTDAQLAQTGGIKNPEQAGAKKKKWWKKLFKYDPNEARDEGGKWTTGGASLGYPGKFTGVIKSLSKDDQERLLKQATELAKQAEAKIKELHPEDNHQGDSEWHSEYNKADNLWMAAQLAESALKPDADNPIKQQKFVAIDEKGNLRGSASGRNYKSDAGDNSAYLDTLASFQRGAGSQLLHTFEKWAMDNGRTRVVLHPTDFAIPFYEAEGYHKAVWPDLDYGSMVKDLKQVGKSDADNEPIGALAIPHKGWTVQKADEYHVDKPNDDKTQSQKTPKNSGQNHYFVDKNKPSPPTDADLGKVLEGAKEGSTSGVQTTDSISTPNQPKQEESGAQTDLSKTPIKE